MDVEALQAYVSEAEQRIASTDSLSKRNTQLRLVRPFLTTLGWSLDEIVAEYEVPDYGPVDFALLVEDAPEIFVQTCACSTDLSEQDAEALRGLLLDTGVDWGILTNGRQFVFAGVDDTGAVDRRGAELVVLPDRMDVVERYTEAAASRRVAHRQERFAVAARQLDSDREAIHTDLTERVVATTGEDVAGTVDDAVDAFLDRLCETFRMRAETANRPGDADTDNREASHGTRGDAGGPSETAGLRKQQDGERQIEESDYGTEQEVRKVSVDEVDELATPDIDVDPDQTLLSDIKRDEQFVVRFFDGRSSVGAVGHRNAATATRLAIEYLLEQRALGGSITLPWGPQDGHTVLDHELDGPSVALQNGWQLDTTRSLATARETIETLAGKSGLRTMFQGDWSANE
ncbi:hypothetical protein [Natranaeroarchaeum aerophilus]|uniref:Type I restriction enzyme R protein N-terminal domain-containing protein n=1 Tax=Natranaeroarchaeum aerophilus TaxID=2917711 RepID=A0AAE3FTC3_9EURY|nr:hypothetical protein [Natranaeroarchaeum aerophilus]MCL9814944.1 hypothetical protein [Natranaeroarchaeum aerophilus]